MMRLALAGAATFVASQILHIPANSVLGRIFPMAEQSLIVQAIVLGLSAGIFEEVARYLIYRFGRRMRVVGAKPSSWPGPRWR